MIEERPTIFWDFGGTLGYREGMFSNTLFQILNENVPTHGVSIENIRAHLNGCFPWNRPEVPHLDLSDPKEWWLSMEATFARIFTSIGVESGKAVDLARLSHQRFVEVSSFKLFEDTIATLEFLRNSGWRHVILSNHVPELPQIVEALGLGRLIDKCISSALVGYEKPHPEIFRIALELTGNPTIVWMVGDNLRADVIGAEGVDIDGILVRNTHNEGACYFAQNLWDCAKIINSKLVTHVRKNS